MVGEGVLDPGAGVRVFSSGELSEQELAVLFAERWELTDQEGLAGAGEWALVAEVEDFLARQEQQERQDGQVGQGRQDGQVGRGRLEGQEGQAGQGQYAGLVVEELRAGLGAVAQGLGRAGAVGAAGLVAVLDEDLVGAVSEVGKLRNALVGVGFSLAAEAAGRGLHNQVGLSLVNWLGVHCEWLSREEACAIQAVVRAGETYWGGPLALAVREGATGVHRAALVARTIRRLVPSLSPEQAVDYAGIATEAAKNPQISDADLGKVCQKLLIDLLDQAPRDGVKDTAQAMRRVSRRRLGQGMTRFTIDAPEPEAVLIEGVLNGPLAAPRPDPTPDTDTDTDAGADTGAVAGGGHAAGAGAGGLDLRSPGQRKFDAFMLVFNRGMANPGAPASTGRASVMVTVKADPVTGKPAGAAFVNTGAVLDAGQAGRFACIGDLTPVVLGQHGEPLNLGRTVRLATPGQFKTLMVRDSQCTYPGCDVPGTWCDAHHLIWWCRGGGTDIAHLVLLCPRHHTIVHDKDLHATVTGSVVTWHV